MQISKKKKKIARFLIYVFRDWICLRDALIILIGVEKFRYKCTGYVILKYTGPRTDFLVLYYDCKYDNYDDTPL